MKIKHLAVAALLMTTPLTAQAEATLAVLNIQQIMRESLAAKSVKVTLEGQQKSFQSEMVTKEQALQKKEKELAQQRSVLSPEEFEKRVKEFRTQATAAQREVQAKKSKLDKAFADALATIQKTVMDIVAEKAKAEKIQAVAPTSQLLYADPSLDITQDVLTKLNQRLPKVQVKF
jgi:Skp family chaperone for outer membrane proteins